MNWDKVIDFCVSVGFPIVLMYQALVGNVFLNVAAKDASLLESAADTFLIPFQYLFAGREAAYSESGWKFTQRFDYEEGFWPKTAISAALLPPSFALGVACKTAAYFWDGYEARYLSMKASLETPVASQNEVYSGMGISILPLEEMETFLSEGYPRRPGDELHLAEEKQALREISQLLNEANILWWVDCGTCLGAYRYGGVIPWDFDIDIAVLLPDFERVFQILKRLDPAKYAIVDWSSREHPKSCIRVYLKKAKALIDIYHFSIDPVRKEIAFLLSWENNIFIPESWKIRERRFKVPVAFEDVFPLKKGNFDGVEVLLPSNPAQYLRRYYGENLAPVRIFDPESDSYERDLSHPYWQNSCVH